VVDSPWRLGPFRHRQAREQVIFGQVREDYSFEASLAAGDVLCVASGGDLAFESLVNGARSVSAVDVNVAQLWLIELKVLALKMDRYEDVLACFAEDAMPYYSGLRGALSGPAVDYFDRNQASLRSGLQNCGAADRTIRLLSRLFRTLFRSATMVNEFLGQTDIAEQREFYRRRWNDWRWRFAFDAAFNPVSLKLVLSGVFSRSIPKNFASDFRSDFDEVFLSVPNAINPFVWQALVGRYPPSGPPAWLREENWELLKSKLPDLNLHQRDLASFLESCERGSFGAVFLTNILDVVPLGYREGLMAALGNHCPAGCHVVSRSFFAGNQLQELVDSGQFSAGRPPERDRSFFCRKTEHVVRQSF
jgi:S-adenosylmethionine-diacylglycerol 3-amino-3-carboxypropyl transferase